MTNESIEARDHPGLTPAEKEVTIRLSRATDQLHVCSDVGSITKRLLHHPDFEETDRKTINGAVVQVTGTLPVSTLSIKSEARESSHLGQVVSGGVFDSGE